MKICIINNLYKPYLRGGAERILEIIVEGLEEAGNEVFVISTKPIRGVQLPIGSWTPKLRIFYPWNLISYYNLAKLPKFLRAFWHLINVFNIQSYFKIKKILRAEKPDIVMTHNLTGVGFLTALAVKRFDRSGGSDRIASSRHIHTLHDIQLLHPSGLMFSGREKIVDSFVAKVYQVINKKLFNSPDIIISPSQWLLDEYVKRGFFKDSKRVVLRNPIDKVVDSGSPLPTQGGQALTRNDNERFFTFLYVGQIEKHKGIELLIESFAKLKNSCELWIVGEGYGSQKSKVKSQKLGLNNIKFLGRQTPNEVRQLMQQANCLVVPSLCYENQPTVIFEAQQNNLPVIASNIGGIPEIFTPSDAQHHTGLAPNVLFKAGNSESLKNKMEWIVDNYDRIKARIGTESHNYMTTQEYIDKILSL